MVLALSIWVRLVLYGSLLPFHNLILWFYENSDLHEKWPVHHCLELHLWTNLGWPLCISWHWNKVNHFALWYTFFPSLFFQTPYQGKVSEDAPQGFSVLKVSARDADVGSNGQITYSLHGPGAEEFRLDPHTGRNGIYQHREKGYQKYIFIV